MKQNFRSFHSLTVILLMTVSIVFTSCDKRLNKEGSGVVISQTRNLQEFSMLDVDGSYDIRYHESEESFVEITTDDNIMPLVKTYVQEGVLFIEMDDQYHHYDWTQMTLHIYHSGVNHVQLNGDIQFTAMDTITTNSFRLDHNGKGLAKILFQGNDLRVGIDGSADITADGSAQLAEYHINGNGKIEALGLHAYDAVADIKGRGDIYLHCDHHLTAIISGMGDIRYTGSPSVTTDIEGSGEVGPY
ncbi:MAG: hypothetical protein RL220_837 [Bacteroidota bacterium]